MEWKKYKEYRGFGGILSTVCLGIGLWLMSKNQTQYYWFIGVALALMFVTLFLPQVLSPIYKIWMKFGDILGWINSHILLSLIYYGLFTPTGLIMKLLGKDPILKKKNSNTTSYWKVKDNPDFKETMKFQF
ncbi:MAG: hypothetical protein HQM12_15025 [SAR324 cluster bacterium]|nr:hypothetical protein [SAR324 cluster bacterium]